MKPNRHGYRWNALSKSVRARFPICERCREALSEEVHHVKPVSQGGSVFDPRNLMALCRKCHYLVENALSSKPALFGQKRAERGGAVGTYAGGRRQTREERLGPRLKWTRNRL